MESRLLGEFRNHMCSCIFWVHVVVQVINWDSCSPRWSLAFPNRLFSFCPTLTFNRLQATWQFCDHAKLTAHLRPCSSNYAVLCLWGHTAAECECSYILQLQTIFIFGRCDDVDPREINPTEKAVRPESCEHMAWEK